MTRWRGGYRHPTGTITHNKVEDALGTVTRTSNRDTCILAAPFPDERTNIPPWIRKSMNCHQKGPAPRMLTLENRGFE
jgi:hypothetical protein